MKVCQPPPYGRSVRIRWIAAIVVGVVTFLRLSYLFFWCPYDLAPDEAHYWDWSRHLDWSYYSKGPLVAWIIRAACELFGGWAMAADGSLMPAIRVPAVLCGAGILAGLYVLTWLAFRSDRLAFGTLLVALTVPPLSASSLVMTIDSPFLCCWMWALVFGYRAMVDDRAWAWIPAGSFIALGILAKYTMALWLLSAALFVLFTQTQRRLLVRPGLWVMVVLAALSAIPILYWNSQNDWVTFRHVAVQAGVVESEKGSGIRWFGPLAFLGGQLGLLLVVWFVMWVLALIRFRPRPGIALGERFLWWMSLPTFVVFAAASMRSPGQLNWPVAAYLSGSVLVAGWLAESLRADGSRKRRVVRWAMAVAIALGAVLTLALHDTRRITSILVDLVPEQLLSRPTPMRVLDPAARLKGGRYLGQVLAEMRARERSVHGSDPVLAGIRWDLPGRISFYADGQPQAYSLGLALGFDRHSQYDLWHPNPADDDESFRGRTFLIVGQWNARNVLRPLFDTVSEATIVEYSENGGAVSRWYVCIGRGFRGFAAGHRPGQGAAH